MAMNMKEVASLRGNDKLYEENLNKIDWSGVGGRVAETLTDEEVETEKKEETDKLYRSQKSVTLTRKEFDDLLEYSSSIPTGTTIGKKWKRSQSDGWWMGEYLESKDEKFVDILWRKIIFDEYLCLGCDTLHKPDSVCDLCGHTNSTIEFKPLPVIEAIHSIERDYEWVKWDGEYEKRLYFVKTINGAIFECWPNAGMMVEVNGYKDSSNSPLSFEVKDNIEVAIWK